MTLAERRMESCRAAAKEVFGFDALRPFQAEVLTPLCAKRDTLAVTATGGGKSLCFQLPAMVLPGPAVIVSPLIALMLDQVTKLRSLGVRAARMSSDVPRSEQLGEVEDLDLIYVSPEKLAIPAFQRKFAGLRLGMIALDEAHCHVEGTLITMGDGSRKPVEQVRVGDAVLSYDTVRREPVVQTVDGIHESRVSPLDLVIVEAEGVSTLLTKDHPIYTAGSYVQAGLLRDGVPILVCDAPPPRSVPLLSEAVPTCEQGSGAVYEDVFSGVQGHSSEDPSGSMRDVWRPVFREVSVKAVLQPKVLHPSAETGACGTDDSSESYVGSRCQRSNEALPAVAGGSVRRWGSRWERARVDEASACCVEGVSDSHSGVSDSDRGSSRRPVEVLAGGLRGPHPQGRDRGGRGQPQAASPEGSRCGEGCRTSAHWLDSSSSDECRSVAGEHLVVQGARVLSLSVPGTRNYFADGILVHNCAITWGKDFRSSYAHLTSFVESHPEAVRFACTATADDEVEAGIHRIMALRDPVRVVTSPWRPNIDYVVRREAGFSELADLVGKAQSETGSQIVYVSSRRASEEVAQRLRDAGLDAQHYHAGMNPLVRTQTQNRYMAGTVRCVVATNAFGMGIDKPDIRLIAHWHMPGSLFNYLQETGRASRDGLPATAWLNIGKDAEKTHNFFIELSNPEFYVYERLWAFLTGSDRQPVRCPAAILGRASGVSERMSGQIDSALAYLEFTGHIRVGSAGAAYELPIISPSIAASVVRGIRGSRLGRGVVHYEVGEGEADQHMRFITSGACRSKEPSEIALVELLRRDLRVTPLEIADKKRGAKMKVLTLHRFADAPDRRMFVEALFARQGSIP